MTQTTATPPSKVKIVPGLVLLFLAQLYFLIAAPQPVVGGPGLESAIYGATLLGGIFVSFGVVVYALLSVVGLSPRATPVTKMPLELTILVMTLLLRYTSA